MKCFNSLSLLVTLSCLLGFGLSWWEIGHMLVSQIAHDQLLLSNKNVPLDKFTSLIEALNPFTDGASNSFAEAAVWADDIKEVGATFFNDYHFIDITYDPQYMFASMSQMQQDVNAINTIEWAMKVLNSNKDATSFQRAIMARMLIHIVGDIHQPLHSVTMYNGSYKTGDMGGNLQKIISVGNESVNLHAYFDSIANVASFTSRFVRPMNDSGKAYISDLVRQIMTDYPSDAFKNRMALNKTTKSWAVESFELAKQHIYPYFEQKNRVTQEYQDEMRAMCFKQIAIGGYRLASLIESIYA